MLFFNKFSLLLLNKHLQIMEEKLTLQKSLINIRCALTDNAPKQVPA